MALRPLIVEGDGRPGALEQRLGNVPMSEVESWRDDNVLRVMQARLPLPTNPEPNQ